MKLTKYEHACIVLEEQGRKLAIDPGSFTPQFGPLDNIAAVVVTHAHPDHFDAKHLSIIIQHNPGVHVFTTTEVASQFNHPAVHIVIPGQHRTVGPFDLHFNGGTHAVIHPDTQTLQNIGVRVGDTFYYPGDSFTLPDTPVRVLAVPVNAPWAKVSESMDFIAAAQPKTCTPTHNGLLSKNGQTVYNNWLNQACQKHNTQFAPLQPGESIII